MQSMVEGAGSSAASGIRPLHRLRRSPSPVSDGGGTALERETKFARAALSEVEADGSFHGYASLFGETDLNRDLVMPGAFAKTIAKRGAGGVRMLFQHDPAAPIGVWQEVREDRAGCSCAAG